MHIFFHRPRAILSQDWDFDCASEPIEQLLKKLTSSKHGLARRESRRRLFLYGKNEIQAKASRTFLQEMAIRIVNPLILLLLVIGSFSFFFGDKVSTAVVLLMILMSIMLSYFQENKAEKAAAKLSALVTTKAKIWRQGALKSVPVKEAVPGDIIELSAGDIIAGDVRIIESNDLFVNQSTLTGESLPVEKHAGSASRQTSNEGPQLANMAFMGSSVISGTGKALIVHTGKFTYFGRLSHQLLDAKADTIFDKQINDFIWLMIRSIFIVVMIIVAIYFVRGNDMFQAVMYALAIALQITPETVPMILTINLSRGALDMAKRKVIVKRLFAIQNFGGMDVLCSDKTGTLTLDRVTLQQHLNVLGEPDDEVFKYGYINSYYETGLKNILKTAILRHDHPSLKGFSKVDEIPFDFERKIVTVVVDVGDQELLVSQGAPESIFNASTHYAIGQAVHPILPARHRQLKKIYDDLSKDGFRVLAVAYRPIKKAKKAYSTEDERDLILKGFLAFMDPPKADAKEAVDALHRAGVDFKIITGDSEYVTAYICNQIGLDCGKIAIGDQIDKLSDKQLAKLVDSSDVFARTSPLQKERIIRALKSNGHVVGYLGDGINDVLSLKAADISISVNNAVDVAKETASIILLEKSLHVLVDGVYEGRRVFENFNKYLRMTSTVNMGYIITAIGASIFLPFLPMLPVQLILNNYLYEISQTAIPSDNIDEENIKKPRRWHISSITKSMLILGPIVSFFDLITFAFLWFGLAAYASPEIFQTGWFLQATICQLLIIFVMRTQKLPFWQSRPSRPMLYLPLAIIALVIALPYLPLAPTLHLIRMPWQFYPALTAIIGGYLAAIWLAKNRALKYL